MLPSGCYARRTTPQEGVRYGISSDETRKTDVSLSAGKFLKWSIRYWKLSTFPLFLLSGCNLAPDYRKPTLPPVPATFRESGPWTPVKPQDTAGRGAWWSIMADAELDRLEERIGHGSPQLAAAVARYDQARALVRRARAEFFPEIDATASVQRERTLFTATGAYYDYRDYAAGGIVSWEPDIWGRIRNLVVAARADAQASAADLGAVRLSLEAELGEDYFRLRGLDASISLLRKTVTAYAAALDLTTKRFTGGVANELDVGRAKTQLASTQSRLDQLVANRALIENAIAVLIGEQPSAFSVKSSGDLPSSPVIPIMTPSHLLERRPDVAAAERHMMAANARIGVARAAFFPNITLGATGGSETITGALLSAGTGVWALGPALATLAVFDGGRRFADLAVMHGQYVESAANYRQIALNAFREVEDQLSLLNHLADASARQEEAVSAAERTNRLATIQYREGAVDYLQVVIAQTAELQAREDMITVNTHRLVSAIDLVRAMGGGWLTPAS